MSQFSIRLRQLLPLLVCAAAASACTGSEPPEPVAPAPEPVEAASAGRWHFLDEPHRSLTPELRDELARMLALGYLQGSQPAPEASGVTVLDRERVQPGLNLYNSGHAPEAFLTDLEGHVLHRWSFPVEQIWPDAPPTHQRSYWRRVTWLPDGEILAIFEGSGLLRLDRDSRLLWAYRGPDHHQAVPAGDGTVLTLTRRPRDAPEIDPDQPVLDDHLARFSSDGQLLEEISLLDAFRRSPYAWVLEAMRREGDLFHTNSVHPLDGRFADRAPWLRRGNVLLASFFLDAVFVLDPQRREIVWALRGDGELSFRAPHDPRLLDGGSLLLVDNWGRGGKSRVLEFDPLRLRLAWQYPPAPESDFHTPTCGTGQRLANGNTLITESDRGRAFEVTPGGEVVWEFFNPHRAGPERELIATLFEVRRVPEDYLP